MVSIREVYNCKKKMKKKEKKRKVNRTRNECQKATNLYAGLCRGLYILQTIEEKRFAVKQNLTLSLFQEAMQNAFQQSTL